MNNWRMAFFLLLGMTLLAIIGLILYVAIPSNDYVSYEAAEAIPPRGNTVMVATTKADFEDIANSFIRQEMEDQPLPVVLSVEDDVRLSTSLPVFSANLPVLLRFEPLVQPDGNLLLEQKSVEIGNLNLPPEQALKLLRDSVELPAFMEVMPAEEEILLKLTEIPVGSGLTVRAAAFDLEEDNIQLNVTIQNE